MKLSRLKTGDVVECDVRGRRLHAVFTTLEIREGVGPVAAVQPISHNVSYQQVTARQVVAIFRRLKS